MLKKFIYLILICILPFIGMGDVLIWTVNDSAIIHKDDGETEGIYAFLSPYEEADGMAACARVKVTGGGLTEPIILPIYLGDGTWNSDIDPEMVEWGVELGESGDGRGYGAYWNQSLIPNEATAETLFQIELGHGVDNWETVAYSDYYTKAMLDKQSYTAGSIAPLGNDWGGWTPTDFYTTSPAPPIPEPTTGLLFLVGASLLTLKRKHT